MNDSASISRRQFVVAGTSACTAAMSLTSVAEDLVGLGGRAKIAQAQSSSLPMYGSLVAVSEAADETPMGNLITETCSLITVAGPIYWKYIQPNRGEYLFDGGDRVAAFAKRHRLLLRAHTLLWYQAEPEWLHSINSPIDGARVLTEHIKTVVGHFRGKVRWWDVANEVVRIEDGRSDGLRVSRLLQLLGPDYLVTAIHVARDADPGALLGINENHLEASDRASRAKRAATLQLLRTLKARDAAPNYLGIQAHLTDHQSYSEAEFGAFLDRVRDLGIRVLITELDVDDSEFPPDFARRDSAVADTYARFLAVVTRHDVVDAVITWGLSDRGSWLQGYHPRTDGLPQRPLPFDLHLQPKLAWNVIRDRTRPAK